MSAPYTFPYIPNARPAPIDDNLLAQLIQVADDARAGNASQAEAEWLLHTAAPLLRELAARRAAMAGTIATAQIIQIVGR